jgi:hypothetical protein
MIRVSPLLILQYSGQRGGIKGLYYVVLSSTDHSLETPASYLIAIQIPQFSLEPAQQC